MIFSYKKVIDQLITGDFGAENAPSPAAGAVGLARAPASLNMAAR